MSVASPVRWKLPSLEGGSPKTDLDVGAAPIASAPIPEPEETVEPPEPVSTAADDRPSVAESEVKPESLDDTFDEPIAAAAEATAAVRDAAYAEGYEAGLAEGREAGLAAGRADGQAALAAEAAHLTSALDYLATPLEEHDSRLEDELVALTVAVARQLVRRELATSPGEIVPVVREALAALPSATRGIDVHLHPEDAALVRDALASSAESAAWQIVEDPLLSRGGCRVEAGYSHVDATLETRLQHIATVLASRERRDD